MDTSQHKSALFQQFIWNFYAHNKREFAWRNNADPYSIVVSEIMLQQTQTHRVILKYEQFIDLFPTFACLAQVTLAQVLAAWQGLGYNRRAKFLHQIAQKVVSEFGGLLPEDPSVLQTFPGIGKATAASIAAFAFNKPTVFIETNIRAVFIHSFFQDRIDVHDNELFPLIAATVDQHNPREWYYALMDYGVYLKKLNPNPSRKSKHHVVQSKFEGSDRQIRGMIVRTVLEHGSLHKDNLLGLINKEAERVAMILDQLQQEQLIIIENDLIRI
jgi:A/G-specific adenine glycosylase